MSNEEDKKPTEENETPQTEDVEGTDPDVTDEPEGGDATLSDSTQLNGGAEALSSAVQDANKPKPRVYTNQELTAAVLGHHRNINAHQDSINKLIDTVNKIVERINNLTEEPVFIAGLLQHINDLYGAGQVLFIQLHQSLSDQDKELCYRGMISMIPEEERGEDGKDHELIVERFDLKDRVWGRLAEGDPVLNTIVEAVYRRLVSAKLPVDEFHYFTVQVVEGADAGFEDDGTTSTGDSAEEE